MLANSAVLAAVAKAVVAYGAYCDKQKRGYSRHQDADMIEMFEEDKADAIRLLDDLKSNKDFSKFMDGVYDLDTAAREELYECLEKAGLARAIAYVVGDNYDPDDDPAKTSVDFLPPPEVKKGQIWADLSRKRKKIRTLQAEENSTKKTSIKCRVFNDGKDTGRVVTVKVDHFRLEREKYRLLDVMDMYREIKMLRAQFARCQNILNDARIQLATANSIAEDAVEELDNE